MEGGCKFVRKHDAAPSPMRSIWGLRKTIFTQIRQQQTKIYIKRKSIYTGHILKRSSFLTTKQAHLMDNGSSQDVGVYTISDTNFEELAVSETKTCLLSNNSGLNTHWKVIKEAAQGREEVRQTLERTHKMCRRVKTRGTNLRQKNSRVKTRSSVHQFCFMNQKYRRIKFANEVRDSVYRSRSEEPGMIWTTCN